MTSEVITGQKGHLKILKSSYSVFFLLTPDLFKAFQERQHYENTNLCQNPSSTFVYGPIFMKICMNANITQFFHQIMT